MALLFQSKAMALISFLCVSLLFLSVAGDDKPSAYEAIWQYDFPIGILPKGVTGYDLNPSTGAFSAYLNGTCSFTLDNSYELKYKSTIKGVISKGRLRKLSGVSVKVLLLWFNIVEVKRGVDELEFSVGLISANFGIRNFLESPQCGCGFNCANGEERKVKLNRFVSSS
ncbi:unnamed protein product [Ilex paraguariensis]|uniref:Uncharacterized protein n=1 Tax=Ilex paraguariensis TaxID=185542 RepID=A0ABC8QU32_9AQUA